MRHEIVANTTPLECVFYMGFLNKKLSFWPIVRHRQIVRWQCNRHLACMLLRTMRRVITLYELRSNLSFLKDQECQIAQNCNSFAFKQRFSTCFCSNVFQQQTDFSKRKIFNFFWPEFSFHPYNYPYLHMITLIR